MNCHEEHDGNLRIILPDTYGTEGFLQNAPDWLAKWTGIRIDSGDPATGAETAIRWWKSRGEDPLDKLVIFSDGLDVDKIIELQKQFEGRVRVSFGWGTMLTNDFRGLVPDDALKAFSLVCKAVKADGNPTVKLSDNPRKAMGPEAELDVTQRGAQRRELRMLRMLDQGRAKVEQMVAKPAIIKVDNMQAIGVGQHVFLQQISVNEPLSQAIVFKQLLRSILAGFEHNAALFLRQRRVVPKAAPMRGVAQKPVQIPAWTDQLLRILRLRQIMHLADQLTQRMHLVALLLKGAREGDAIFPNGGRVDPADHGRALPVGQTMHPCAVFSWHGAGAGKPLIRQRTGPDQLRSDGVLRLVAFPVQAQCNAGAVL